MTPRFTVIIPTRNRAATLRHSLATVLAQSFDDFEVIVSDNFSPDDTRAVVEEASSPRVRYFRTPKPLAMSDNWEFAIEKVRGEYVMIIGDDDGILPDGLAEADRAIREAPVDVIRSESAAYFWPSIGEPVLKNRLIVPFARENRIIDSRSMMMEIAHGRVGHGMLPMLYNSAIPRRMIDAVRKSTGRVFGDLSPDIYSGFAIAYLNGRYASLGRPIFIGGTSGASTGWAMCADKARSGVAKEFQRMNDEAGLPWHRRVPIVHSLRAAVAESYETLRDRLFAADRELAIDRRTIIRQSVEDIPADTDDEWREGLQHVRSTLADDAAMQRWFDAQPWRRSTPSSTPWFAWRRGFAADALNLDASEFGVADIHGAAQLVAKIIGDPTPDAFRWPEAAARETLPVRRRVRTAARVLLRGR